MITHSDDGPDFEPDDPLAVILRPASDYLGPPPGRYEAIRRGAARRRLLRAAAGIGLSCAAAALIVVPLRLSAPQAPASPTVPLAPPPASSPSAVPTPSASPEQLQPGPGEPSPTDSPRIPPSSTAPTPVPSTVPTSAPSPSVEPSVARSVPPTTLDSSSRP
ncbi:hypothetical protein QQS16_39535 [Streptomyces sp. ALI-76-A]|nr:hypothetical protein [Streptomyces sp. ALI-76-A]MDL5206058.1 hypothetical protein [Streptomyces sp. ALI-76-A]